MDSYTFPLKDDNKENFAKCLKKIANCDALDDNNGFCKSPTNGYSCLKDDSFCFKNIENCMNTKYDNQT